MSVRVLMAVSVTQSMTVLVKQHQSDNVDDKAHNADVQHPVSVLNTMFIMCQALDCLHYDSEAQCYQEHGVHQCTQYLGPSPAVRVLVGVQL